MSGRWADVPTISTKQDFEIIVTFFSCASFQNKATEAFYSFLRSLAPDNTVVIHRFHYYETTDRGGDQDVIFEIIRIYRKKCRKDDQSK